MPAPRSPWSFRIACLLVAVGLLGAYANHFGNGYVLDDNALIAQNPAIRSLGNVGRFFGDPDTAHARPGEGDYRPVTTLSYAVDHVLAGGLEPRVSHAVNFALLLALAALLFSLFDHVLQRGADSSWRRWAVLFGVALFCLHTANTGTVSYLAARASLLAALAVAGSFFVYLRRPDLRPIEVHTLPMAIGILAHPAAAAYAPLLLLYLWLFPEAEDEEGAQGFTAALRRAAPALVIALLVVAFVVRMDPRADVGKLIHGWRYAITQPFVWLHGFRLFLLPTGLTPRPDWTAGELIQAGRLVSGFVFVPLLIAATMWLARRPARRPAAFGLGWFAVALLPTSSIFPHAVYHDETRFFLPYIGLALAAGWGLLAALDAFAGEGSETRGNRVPALAIGAAALALLVAHGVGTQRRNVTWQGDEAIWQDVVRKAPDNPQALMNLGVAVMEQGRVREAVGHFEAASELRPDYAKVELNLAIAQSALGDRAASERHFRRAIEIEPEGDGHAYFGRWLLSLRRGPEAMEHLERAIAEDPGDVATRRLRVRLLAALGDEEAMGREARELLAVSPTDAIARSFLDENASAGLVENTPAAFYERGTQFLREQNWLDAANDYRRAVALGADTSGVWNDLGWAVMKLGFPERSLELFEKALAIEPAMGRARANLAHARTLAAAASDR